MDEMDLLGDTATYYPIPYNGKTYKLCRSSTGKFRARLIAWLCKHYTDRILERKPFISQEQFNAEMLEYYSLKEQGYFDWLHGEYKDKVLPTFEGAVALVKFALMKEHPEISDEEVVDLLMFKPELVEMGMRVLLPAQFITEQQNGQPDGRLTKRGIFNR